MVMGGEACLNAALKPRVIYGKTILEKTEGIYPSSRKGNRSPEPASEASPLSQKQLCGVIAGK